MTTKLIMKASAALLAIGLTACTNENGGALLECRVVGEPVEDGLVTYCPNGNIFENVMTEFEIGKDSVYNYNTELNGETGDVTIEMSGIGYFGAHLVKGQTLKMTVEKEGDEWKARFEGPQADICSFVNEYTQRFDQMLYWSPDPGESKPNTEYRQLLEENYDKVKSALSSIEDAKARDYYTRLTEGMHKWLTIRLIMDSCENDHSNYKLNDEYRLLVKDIDINDPVNLQTNMAFTALNSLCNVEESSDNQNTCLRLMELTDSLVTNPHLRHFLVQMIGQQYYMYGDGTGDYETFNKKFLEWAGEDKEIAQAMINQFMEKKRSTEITQAGAQAPDVELTTPDGKTVKLSSLIQGKFTYIDVWATWCGPCCKEIPFVEKLVAQYKDNPKVQFLSISIDQNKDAWLKKLEKDKPQWQQFIIQDEVEAQFSKDWGITGIPRFIMINPDGTIFSSDATRPSDPETVKTIDAEIKK